MQPPARSHIRVLPSKLHYFGVWFYQDLLLLLLLCGQHVVSLSDGGDLSSGYAEWALLGADPSPIVIPPPHIQGKCRIAGQEEGRA